uniref:Uncharacterized protein n=1 Tax=Acrobeloides nanus TaxID=290746 RepID=A0A914CM31_9BILA
MCVCPLVLSYPSPEVQFLHYLYQSIGLEFIEKLKNADSVNEFVQLLDKANEWCNVFGKTEMGRWVDVLNRCDSILETAITKHKETGSLAIDTDDSLERPLISVLRFTWLLFENSFTRSVYSSMDRLLHLLDCTKMSIVVQALRLLLIISKSSRYISQHMSHDDQQMLSMKLTAITECWNGKHLRNLEMKDCCGPETPKEDVFHLTYRTHSGTKDFHVDHKWPIEKARMELQNVLISSGNEVDESEKILLMTRLRLAYSFNDYHARMYSAMARLISISVLFYSRCLLDEQTINILADDKLIEQICALVYLNTTADSPLLDTVKTEALKTLASIVFLEKPRKIQLVVDNLGLNSYHGFTTTLMRRCVETLKAGLVESQGDFSVNFVTALFSLLYHVCGYDYGSDSLISCSMVEILLGVVQTYTLPESQISFVTRSVRIIDILTGIDAADFNSHDGMNVIVNRFIYEVDMCKQQLDDPQNPNRTTICHQQRTALMKSLLNFLKRSVVDTNFAAQIRRIMEGNLPAALIHIIQNPLFYGSSLLHSAIQLTTSFIYQEPAQLTLLQDKNLTEALTKSIFKDDFPISRDIIMSLPNICSALCLNERGLKSFNEQNPLQRIFRIIFSTKFLSSIRKRKNEIFDTATTLGAAFDELMRHQPTLRKEVVSAFCQVLDEIIKLANSEPYKCVISSNQSKWTSEIEEPS